MRTDTIAAIATALSDAGIGIIRISGGEAIAVADQIFRDKIGRRKLAKVKSHTMHYGYIVDGKNDNSVIDEVLISVMKAPNSYTAEDTVEINCHGGILVMQKVLEEAIKAGARMAAPGEFTKRAFLNGRIDLSKAEAVMDVISSQNEFALRSSMNQLQGKLSEEIKRLRAEILYEIAFIESALDDPEHISLEGYSERLLVKTENLLDSIGKLIETAENGRMLKEGISTVIVGKPNVGKSSLMNLLAGEERAIVTDVPGTTRDILEEYVRFRGIGFKVIDTAGIRNTEDAVEKIGVGRAKKYAADADLIVYVVDASVELDENDREIISLIYDKNVIILLNKTDLDAVVTEADIWKMFEEVTFFRIPAGVKMLRTSVKENIGMDAFEIAITDLFFAGKIHENSEVVITNMRHKEALLSAYESLRMVKKSIEDGMEEDFYSIDLMSAYGELGKVTGEQVGDELVEEIFSKFCMGK